MPEVSDYLVRIKGDITSLEQALGKAKSATATTANQMEKGYSGVTRAVGTLRTAVLRLGSVVGIVSFGAMVTGAFRLADELKDVSAQFGITTTQLQALRFAAEETGIGAGQAQSGWDFFSRTVADAAEGGEEAMRKFQALGIKITDTSGNVRSIGDLSEEAAKKIAAMSDRTQQNAAAVDLFGRSGVRLVPLLEELGGGWDALAGKADAAGQVMSEETVQALADAERAIEKLKNRIIIVVGEIAGAINRLIEGPQTLAEVEASLKRLNEEWAKLPAQTSNAFTQIEKFANAASIQKLEKLRQSIKDNLRAAREDAGAPVVTTPEEDYTTKKQELELLSKGTKAVKEKKDAVAELIAKLREELDIIKLSGIAREQEIALREAQAAAQAQNRDLTIEEIAAIKDLVAQREKIKEGQEKAKEAQKDLAKEIEETEEKAQDMGDALAGALVSSAVQGNKLLDILKAVLAEIVNIMSQAGTDYLGDIFGKLISGIAGIGNSPASSVNPGTGPGGMGFVANWGGPRAEGGDVERGKFYKVGEEGPEFFAPGRSGTIIPNRSSPAAGVTVNQSFQISTGVAQTVRAEVMGMMPRIKAETVQAVAEARQRGGSYSRAMGS